MNRNRRAKLAGEIQGRRYLGKLCDEFLMSRTIHTWAEGLSVEVVWGKFVEENRKHIEKEQLWPWTKEFTFNVLRKGSYWVSLRKT